MTNQSELDRLRAELERKERECQTLKIQLLHSHDLARQSAEKARNLSAACQHHLSVLDGTTRRGE